MSNIASGEFSANDHRPTGQTVGVIGTGYVGLTAGACLAYLGHTVVCADASPERVASLRQGIIPIVEPGMDALVLSMVAAGRLSFVTDNLEVATQADHVFLCLPTPQDDDGSADLSRVRAVARQIGPHLRPGTTVVNKSTVPVGTADLVASDLGREDVSVVSNPEFLAEGTAIRNFLEPDRVVVGSRNPEAARAVADLYAALQAPVIETDVASAETIKYASNAFLAIRLSFVNAMASVCEVSGADIRAVTRGMGADRRIGSAFMKPGPGWGGSCFPKDTAALVHTAEEHGFDFELLKAAVASNEDHRRWLVGKVVRAAGGSVAGVTVALWGLTFKAGTDDLRDSPAIEIARDLIALGAEVRAFDPTVTQDLHGIVATASPQEAAAGASVLVVTTEWPEFGEVDLVQIADSMSGRHLVDCRNVVDAAAAQAAGFTYDGLGYLTADELQRR